MKQDLLVKARKRAEDAVREMPDGPLKVAAFQTILTKLLSDADSFTEGESAPKAMPKADEQPKTLTDRVLAVASEGFFKDQRSLADVRSALASRGWHYPSTTLSGVMQTLVRRRALRRQRSMVNNKELWRYSEA